MIKEQTLRPPNASWQEFPKWVGGVVVNNRAEEAAIRAAAAAEVVNVPEKAFEDLPLSREGHNRCDEEALTSPGLKPATGIIAAEPARPPLSAATRMARMRERQRLGQRTIQINVSTTQIEGMIAAGFLDPVVRGDAAAVALAVGRLLDRHAARSV